MKRHIIVIGASAGGIEALRQLCGLLPADLPATVFIVLHTGLRSVLAHILDRDSAVATTQAEDGETITSSHIYVAPPDYHLELEGNKIRLNHGPRDNGYRPSVDVLFRSAAEAYGPSVAGVILSGALDDGVAGLFAIKARGGTTLVQSPEEALVPEMPRRALELVTIDYSLPIRQLAPKLVALAHDETTAATSPTGDSERIPSNQADEENAEFFPVTCPECDGPLFETRNGALLHFACKVGHTFSPLSLSEAHNEALERALWTAMRRLNERLEMHSRIVNRGSANETEKGMVARFSDSVEQSRKDISLLRQILEGMYRSQEA